MADEGNPVKSTGIFVQTTGRKPLSLPYSAEREVGLKRCTLRWKADGFAAALDAILEQLQRRRCIHANPEDTRTAPTGKRTQLSQLQRQ